MITKWSTVPSLDHMLDDVMGSMLGTATNTHSFEPAVDIRTTDEEILFICDVPGIKADELHIHIEGTTLTLEGERKFESREGEHLVLGRAYGAFRRAYALPDIVDADKLTASLNDGVLTVRVPKQAKAKPRRITITGEPKEIEG